MEEDIKIEESKREAARALKRGLKSKSIISEEKREPKINKNIEIPGNLGQLLKKIVTRYKLTSNDINDIRTEMFNRINGLNEEIRTKTTIGIQTEGIEEGEEIEFDNAESENVLRMYVMRGRRGGVGADIGGGNIQPMGENTLMRMLEYYAELKIKNNFNDQLQEKNNSYGGFVFENLLRKFGLKSLALTTFQSMHLVIYAYIYIYIYRLCKEHMIREWTIIYY